MKHRKTCSVSCCVAIIFTLIYIHGDIHGEIIATEMMKHRKTFSVSITTTFDHHALFDVSTQNYLTEHLILFACRPVSH